MRGEPPISRVHATAFRVPTDGPAADGTLTWDSTVIVVVDVEAGGTTGLGYTYGAAQAADLINATLAPVLSGKDVWDIPLAHQCMNGTARMGNDPRTSVVDADCRSWDIANLWICDGSVFPTVGGVNPSLTIQAIACRTADRIRALAARGELERGAHA